MQGITIRTLIGASLCFIAGIHSKAAEKLIHEVIPKAGEREAKLPQYYRDYIEPLWTAGETAYFDGVFEGDQAIRLRYHALHHPKPRASVVIIHGFGEQLEKYQETAYDFYQFGYSVYLYDQRGHGASDRLHSRNRSVFVSDFKHYTEDLRIFIDNVVHVSTPSSKVFLFAHSMGGFVASLYIAQNPDSVQGAVLSTPMHQMNLRGHRPWIARTLSVLADTFGFGRHYALGHGEPQPWPFEQAATRSISRWNHYRDLQASIDPDQQNGGASYRWLRQALNANIQLLKSPILAHIRTPILLFQAGDDPWVEAEGQNQFCAAIASCRIIRFEHAKHEVYREQDSIRDPYLSEIKKFFSNLQQSNWSTKDD